MIQEIYLEIKAYIMEYAIICIRLHHFVIIVICYVVCLKFRPLEWYRSNSIQYVIRADYNNDINLSCAICHIKYHV